jgi:NitT/TauT family transport system substrate-binding protein
MKRILPVNVVACALFVATSCAPAPLGSSAATPTPASLTHLVVAFSNVSPTIMPLWVARDAGIFQKHGLDVDLQYVASATTVSAIVSGQMQLGTVGLSEVLGAIAGGADLVIIATQVPGYPYLFEVAPGIQSAADLKGKSIGISRPGSSSDIGTRVVLKKFGIDPDKDVTLVTTGSVSERAAAMKSGAIQAALAGPPDNLTIERQGWHPLFDLAAQGVPAVTLGLVAQRAYRDANQAVVQSYVDALIEGIARVRSDPGLAIQELKTNVNIESDEDLKATYEYFSSQQLMPSLPYPRAEQFSDTLEILGKSNEQLAKLDVAPLLDTSFVASAEQRGLGK